MGKCFEGELENVSRTYEKAMMTNVENIKKFLGMTIDDNILLIGSGGSFSVASTLEYFFRRWCSITKAITPFSLETYASQINKTNFILLTAGGRNSDSLNSYKFVSDLEPRNLLTICMTENAPIKRMQKNNLHNHYFEFDLPSKKDGFLAVNSLLASIILVSKALFELYHDDFFRLKSTPDFNNNIEQLNELESALKKETLIVLHGGMTTPVAIDLESKFSETALGNVQLVDFRNFAHGRHFWLSERKDSTAVIALMSNNDSKTANKTLGLIPNEIPVVKYVVEEENINGLLQAYYDMFAIVNKAGKLKSINPGKPKVEDFGRKMYHISHNSCASDIYKNLIKSQINTSIYRKAGLTTNNNVHGKYKEAYLKYYNSLMKNEFRGIVFDYDGTLHLKNEVTSTETEIFALINYLLSNKILIGIATGRGKSVRVELQKVIEKRFWDSVAIAYYNGAIIGTLGDERQPDNAIDIPLIFEELYNKISREIISENVEIELRPYQITVIFNNGYNYLALQNIQEVLIQYPEVKLVTSSHSIDIILRSTTKRNILKHFIDLECNLGENQFLYIGDAGSFGGNDFDLLQHSNGLSVDNTSKSSDFCWNISPLGLRNIEATKYYLEQIICDKERNVLRFNAKKG